MENEEVIEIVPMMQDDVMAIAEIEKKAFSEPWSENSFLEALAQKQHILRTVKIGQKVVGYGVIYCALDEGELVTIAVDADYRGAQIASALLETLIATAQEKQIKKIFLEVRRSNEGARHLYAKFGFQEIGVRKNFYRFPTEDALLMEVTC